MGGHDPATAHSGYPEDGGTDATGGHSGERWIETPRGSLFFVNALLVFPYVMIVVPLVTRIVVRGALGGVARESTILDTFPLLAGYLLPRYGWLIVIPLFLVIRNLRVEPAVRPRAALLLFLLLHVGFLAWTGAGWMGGHDWTLPGGPP